MAAGCPGDHPLTDVIYYDLKAYGYEADELLKKLDTLMSRDELFDWWEKEVGWQCPPKDALNKIKEQVTISLSRAKENGWETE